MWLLAPVVFSVVSGSAAPRPIADPCGYVTKPEAATLIGEVSGTPMGEGPVSDDDTGAQRTTCLYQHGQVMLLVMVLEFPNADAAGGTVSQEMAATTLEDESASITMESGLGDRAYWGTTDRSAAYLVLRGARVLALVVGGAGFVAADHRAQLRNLAQGALARL